MVLARPMLVLVRSTNTAGWTNLLQPDVDLFGQRRILTDLEDFLSCWVSNGGWNFDGCQPAILHNPQCRSAYKANFRGYKNNDAREVKVVRRKVAPSHSYQKPPGSENKTQKFTWQTRNQLLQERTAKVLERRARDVDTDLHVDGFRA